MPGRFIFLKISGAVIDDEIAWSRLRSDLITLASQLHDDLLYLIPGGGKAVDALRVESQERPELVVSRWKDLSGEIADPKVAAHWLAIRAMDQHAIKIGAAFHGARNIIIPPVSRLLQERDCPLPRSWGITADSITYWLALSLAGDPPFPWVFLLKDVDGVISAGKGAALISRRTKIVSGRIVRTILVHGTKPSLQLPSYPFDEYMFQLVEEFKLPFHVINWRHVDRIRHVLERRSAVPCTRIMPAD
jgi:aspartokinase-like uncharacterized kinase